MKSNVLAISFPLIASTLKRLSRQVYLRYVQLRLGMVVEHALGMGVEHQLELGLDGRLNDKGEIMIDN